MRPSNRNGVVPFAPAAGGVLDCPDRVSCALTAVLTSANANAIASLDMARLSQVLVMIGEKVGAKMSAKEDDQHPLQMPAILRSM
jgi:hypothetical protein